MSHFDEKSGIVASKTDWGEWWQTLEEICIAVKLDENVTKKHIQCVLKNKSIKLVVKDIVLIEGEFVNTIHAEDSFWTLEDKRFLRIVIEKAGQSAANCWSSLLQGQYPVDPLILDEMQKKLALERFQGENPGFDFSGATVSGNYKGGGPTI